MNNQEKYVFKTLKNDEKSPYTAIELFCGAGGMALGLINAGIKIEAAIDAEFKAIKTFQLNTNKETLKAGECWFLHENIMNISFSKHQADIVSGGFPCQSFSFAGKRRGLEDTRGTLFYEFARVVKDVSPKIFIAENVKGLVTHNKGETLKTMIRVFEDLGYHVEYKVLNAMFYDVAQSRERLFIIGVRNDLNIKIEFPKKQPYIPTLRDVISDLKIHPFGFALSYSESKKKVMELVPQGGWWKHLPEGVQKSYMGKLFGIKNGSTGMAKRLHWDRPSPTLTCHPAQKLTERCHPEETRPLTTHEYQRIQCFPEDYVFCSNGSALAVYKLIGNAVPVNLAYHLGNSLINMLNSAEKI
jgi:DNA (cytosine-5)-methyltransferase 1